MFDFLKKEEDIPLDVRQLKLTDKELIYLIDKAFNEPQPVDAVIDEDDEKRIFKELGHIDGLQEYLRLTMARDKDRYFQSQPGLQMMQIQGAYMRMAWLRKKIMQVEKKKGSSTLRTKRHL